MTQKMDDSNKSDGKQGPNSPIQNPSERRNIENSRGSPDSFIRKMTEAKPLPDNFSKDNDTYNTPLNSAARLTSLLFGSQNSTDKSESSEQLPANEVQPEVQSSGAVSDVQPTETVLDVQPTETVLDVQPTDVVSESQPENIQSDLTQLDNILPESGTVSPASEMHEVQPEAQNPEQSLVADATLRGIGIGRDEMNAQAAYPWFSMGHDPTDMALISHFENNINDLAVDINGVKMIPHKDGALYSMDENGNWQYKYINELSADDQKLISQIPNDSKHNPFFSRVAELAMDRNQAAEELFLENANNKQFLTLKSANGKEYFELKTEDGDIIFAAEAGVSANGKARFVLLDPDAQQIFIDEDKKPVFFVASKIVDKGLVLELCDESGIKIPASDGSGGFEHLRISIPSDVPVAAMPPAEAEVPAVAAIPEEAVVPEEVAVAEGAAPAEGVVAEGTVPAENVVAEGTVPAENEAAEGAETTTTTPAKPTFMSRFAKSGLGKNIAIGAVAFGLGLGAFFYTKGCNENVVPVVPLKADSSSYVMRDSTKVDTSKSGGSSAVILPGVSGGITAIDSSAFKSAIDSSALKPATDSSALKPATDSSASKPAVSSSVASTSIDSNYVFSMDSVDVAKLARHGGMWSLSEEAVKQYVARYMPAGTLDSLKASGKFNSVVYSVVMDSTASNNLGMRGDGKTISSYNMWKSSQLKQKQQVVVSETDVKNALGKYGFAAHAAVSGSKSTTLPAAAKSDSGTVARDSATVVGTVARDSATVVGTVARDSATVAADTMAARNDSSATRIGTMADSSGTIPALLRDTTAANVRIPVFTLPRDSSAIMDSITNVNMSAIDSLLKAIYADTNNVAAPDTGKKRKSPLDSLRADSSGTRRQQTGGMVSSVLRRNMASYSPLVDSPAAALASFAAIGISSVLVADREEKRRKKQEEDRA